MKGSKQYQVILFQPYLRRFVLNFGRGLKRFTLVQTASPPKKGMGYHTLPSFENEIHRRKDTWQARLRRFVGIPNVRIKLGARADMYFTYGCLVVGLKPYCTYIETGVALYNYDLKIAQNPLARFIVSVLATRRTCHRLIFLSEAGKKSFFASVSYPRWARRILEAKSIVIYPVPIGKQDTVPKKFSGSLKLLFPGTFYIKGGLEVAHAYERLARDYPSLSLTMITALHMLKGEDREYLESLPGLTLVDAKLSEQEMIQMYSSHDIFVLPTYREGFGLVLIEGMAYGMPIITTDQYATSEMAIDGYNGFVYPNHPFKDYDPKTYKMFGKYHNPSDLYRDLFSLQDKGKLKPIEDFLVASVRRFFEDKSLLEKLSKNSLALYKEKFDADMLTTKLEQVFLEAVGEEIEPSVL